MLSTIETPVRPAPVETPAIGTGITNRSGADGELSAADIADICNTSGARLYLMANECHAIANEREEGPDGYYRYLAGECRQASDRLERVRQQMAKRT